LAPAATGQQNTISFTAEDKRKMTSRAHVDRARQINHQGFADLARQQLLMWKHAFASVLDGMYARAKRITTAAMQDMESWC
jgi:hypothetical protein